MDFDKKKNKNKDAAAPIHIKMVGLYSRLIPGARVHVEPYEMTHSTATL